MVYSSPVFNVFNRTYKNNRKEQKRYQNRINDTDTNRNKQTEQHDSLLSLKSTFFLLFLLSMLPDTDEHQDKADEEHSQTKCPTIVGITP